MLREEQQPSLTVELTVASRGSADTAPDNADSDTVAPVPRPHVDGSRVELDEGSAGSSSASEMPSAASTEDAYKGSTAARYARMEKDSADPVATVGYLARVQRVATRTHWASMRGQADGISIRRGPVAEAYKSFVNDMENEALAEELE